MENDNYIDPSLQMKIYENDLKFKSLLNKGLLSKKDPSQNNNIKIEITKEKDNDNSNNKINPKRNNNIIQNIEKIMKLKEDKEKKKFNTNILLNVPKESKKQKKTNKNNKNINIDETINRLYQNNNNKNKKITNEEETNKSSKSFIDFNQTIERFEQDIKKRNENIEKKKILKEKIEKQKYTYKPTMCKGSKKYNEDNIKENFLERQQNFIDKKELKREIIKTEINKEEEEDKLQSAPNPKIKKSFRNYLNSMEKWEKERLDKIERKKRELEEKIDKEFDYMPKIDEKSAKIAEKNKLRQKQPNTFIRLAEQDKIIKEKKKILAEMYTPSFQPFCYEPLNLNIKYQPKNFFEENNLNSFEQDEESDNNEEKEEGENIDDFDFQQDIMKFTDEQVNNTLRGSLFHHKKKTKK